MIEKVKLINDEDTQACIQKFKKIKRDYQDAGPAGKKNEPILWKKLNEAADRFFEADKAILNNELDVIKDLTAELQSEDCSIKDIKNSVSELNKTRKSPEFSNLQKAIKAYENKKIDKINADKIKVYQDLITLLETADENHLSIHNEIFKALKKPLYTGNKDQLHECTVKLELIAKIEPPDADKIIKQKLALQMLQDKFSGTKNTNDDIKDLLIAFINNLKSKKISAAETKLWKRVCKAIQKLASQLP